MQNPPPNNYPPNGPFPPQQRPNYPPNQSSPSYLPQQPRNPSTPPPGQMPQQGGGWQQQPQQGNYGGPPSWPGQQPSPSGSYTGPSPWPGQRGATPPPMNNPYAPPNGQGWQPQQQTPPPPSMQPPRPKRKKWPWIVGIITVVVVVGIINAALTGGNGSVAGVPTTPSSTQATQTQNQPTQQATDVPTAAPTPTPAFATFGDGTWQVGKDIKAGTWRTRQGSPGCYYARLSGFGGGLGDILSNDNTDGPAIVTIAASDKGFQSQGCGTWTKDLSQITTSKTSWPDGAYFVGTDITAGTYKSSGQTGCYYARLAGFSGGLSDIIANNNTDTPAIVTISSSDKGFESKGCGTWTMM